MSAQAHTQQTGAQFVAVEMPRPQPLGISLTEEEHALLNTHIPGVHCLLLDAAAVMEFIAEELLCGGDVEPGIMSALRLAARGLQARDMPEVEALNMVEMKLRLARLRANGGVVK